MDERTWLDNAGDPHSSEMRVQERYHRVDHDTVELTVKIDDPKIVHGAVAGARQAATQADAGEYRHHGNDLRADRSRRI